MTESFSAFGDLDIDEIPDDPFHIENNVYRWIITKAEFRTSKDNQTGRDRTSANITFNVNNHDSEYHGRPVPQYFTIYPGLTRDDFENMDSETRANVKRNLSNYKMMLRAFKLSESEIVSITPDNINEVLVGQECIATLTNNERNGKKFRNLQYWKPLEDDDYDKKVDEEAFGL